MSSPETLLLVRLLRYQGQLGEEELRDVLHRTAGEDSRSFLEELRASQLVDPEWVDWAETTLRKKARRFYGEGEDPVQVDRFFGQVALSRGWCDLASLEDAILEQQRLRRINLRFRIGEIMVRRGDLTVDQVREILADQGFRMWNCVTCAAVVNLPRGDSGGDVGDCPLCAAGNLRPTIFLESVRADVPVEEVSG